MITTTYHCPECKKVYHGLTTVKYPSGDQKPITPCCLVIAQQRTKWVKDKTPEKT